MNTKTGVLVFLIDGNFVWLGIKKEKYAKGKWNGFGGKLEPGETIEAAGVREVKEECKVVVNPDDLIQVAEFYYHEKPDDWRMFVFRCKKWSGEPKETEEMRPQLFEIDNLPFGQMWDNDKLWIDLVLTKKKYLKGTFWLNDKGNVINHAIKERD